MKFLRVLSIVALVAFFAVSAYAETQNVKVSGDLAIRAFFRNNYGGSDSFTATPNENIQANGVIGAAGNREGVDRPDSNWFMSTTELQVDATLTDNVSTCIRLLNQRDWNSAKAHGLNRANTSVSAIGSGGYGHINDGVVPGTGYIDDQDEFAVDLELAYITLKSFLYSPLTVTVGRQNLWFGKGFIVGANQRMRNADWYGANGLPQPIGAPEYTAQNAFDSVKAVLDFDPWTLTAIFSKIWQNDIRSDDGEDLWGANVGYKFDAYKGEAEGYWFYKRDKEIQPWVDINQSNDVNTLGLRGSFDPIDIISLYAEFAGQFGSFTVNSLQSNPRSRLAGALDVGGECRYFTDKWSWKPKVGVEYIWYSGHHPETITLNDSPASSGPYHGWDPMFRGKTDSLIREFIGRYYFSTTYPFNARNYYNSADNSFQNQHQIIFRGSLQPMDSVSLNGNLNLFWNQEAYLHNFTETRGYIGTEIDLGATWDYTEDVSFNVVAGWFMPGYEVYRNTDAIATDIVGTVKVSF